jgi:PsbP-like protein
LNRPPSNSQDHQPQSTQLSAQNSSTTSAFVTYKDPQGRFSIDYPSNWTAKAATNRFETFQVTFTNTGLGSFAEVDVGTIRTPPLGLEESLKLVMPSLTNSVPNFQLSQDVECQKYTIDGNKACRIIFSKTKDYTSNIKLGAMMVISEHYMIAYSTLPDNFDKLLPTVDQMIGSFKVSKLNTSYKYITVSNLFLSSFSSSSIVE